MSSFPVGKYARYKRATTFFLGWLLRAQALSRHVGQHLTLNSFSDVVQDVAQDPSSLTPKLLNDLPKALAMCQCSITLREYVAKFFPDDDKGQIGHQHFIGLLKSWHAKLKTVQLGPQQATAEMESAKFENYYEVLEVDEDYFPDDTESEAEPGASEESLADRVRLFNEAFAEDLRLEVIYFFLELEELLEGVFSVYDQVKKEQRTMVEATVAVKVAMDAASALTAKLQLQYPALKTAEDVGVVLMDNLPKNFWSRANEAVVEFWKTSAENGAYTFVPGMLIVEFRSMLSTLCSFTTGIPTNPRHGMVLREGFFGETYGEERTPEYAFPDTSNMVILLLQQLPHLYNAILDMKRANGGRLDTSGVTRPFMGLLNEYFTSRTVTVPLVFACICWVKSVAALQGNSGLSRNVGVTIKHTTDLLKRIKETAGRRAASYGSRIAQEFQKQCDQQAQQASLSDHLARANPLMAGFTMLTFDLQYLEMASDVLETTSRFRAFCHLYNALLDQKFLEPIPFFDEILDTYESWIFTPSRKGATRGIYNRTYLLSSHYTAASISEMYRSGALPVKSATGQGQKRIGDFSTIYRLMSKNDTAFLGNATSKAMLNKAVDICAKELFQTRVLSRDLLSLNDDLTDVYNEMADQLNQQRTEPVENAAMMFVMPFLDGLQPNGSMNMGALPGAQRGMRVGAAHVTIIKSMCAKAAAVIKAQFASPPLICEQKYFTFPSKPDFATQEYGPAPKIQLDHEEDEDELDHDFVDADDFDDADDLENDFNKYYDYTFDDEEDSYSVLSELMDLMGLSNGPLSGKKLKYFKAKVTRNPEVLSMISMECVLYHLFDGSETSPGETRDALCTLLHHAVAGTARDATLVEWLIQHGALTNQVTQLCRMGLEDGSLPAREMLPNTMAVHSAAIAGHENMVRILLEADNMKDLNTPTLYSKETLAHLAVKYDHRSMFNMLRSFGADICIRDGNGKRVSDVTTDLRWGREIAAVIAEIEQGRARTDRAKNRDALLRHQSLLRAEEVRKSVAAQCDEERRLEFSGVTAGNAEAKKKKSRKNRKNRKKKNHKAKGNTNTSSGDMAAVAGADTEEVSSKLKDLLLSGASDADVTIGSDRAGSLEQDSLSRIEEAAAAFARLRNPDIPVDDKAADVQFVLEEAEVLVRMVEVCSDPNRINTTDRRIRTLLASDSARIIHMMEKFNRVDHAAISVPALSSVRKLCETSREFINFVFGTAKILVSIDRKPQAGEVFDVLEKRLLKTSVDDRKLLDFQKLVRAYSAARMDLGLGQASSASTLRTLRSM